MERIEEILEKLHASNKEIETFISKHKELRREMVRRREEASKAYLADIQIGKDKIKEQIKSFEQQKAEINTSLKNMRPLLVTATTSGNAEEIKKIQEKMADLKAQEAAIDTQIEFLYTTPIPGSDELFNIVEELQGQIEEIENTFSKAYGIIYSSADEQIKLWEEIKHNYSLYDKHLMFADYKNAKRYHEGEGESIERPKDEASKAAPINMETNRYIFGQYPDYKAETQRSNGPRMD